jgi:hypothetical protein
MIFWQNTAHKKIFAVMAWSLAIWGCSFKIRKLKLNNRNMSNLLYFIAIILVIGWLLGFFVYSAGNLIHILLVIAVIAVIFRLIKGRPV